ncbi:MAG: T9SS C-terminal target domain-containing protein [Bacteroidetes bacterium]|nr:MAG: T9SS C-terminal target domain-containing protein [Bacteroidota bacterium]
MKAKLISILIIFFPVSFSYAITYNVTVCGYNTNPQTATYPDSVKIEVETPAGSGLAENYLIETDTTGNFCTTVTINDNNNSGISVAFKLYQTDCSDSGLYFIDMHTFFIDSTFSDTVLFEYELCGNTPACEVETFGEYKTAVDEHRFVYKFYSNPKGITPFDYEWSFSSGNNLPGATPLQTFHFQSGTAQWGCVQITDAAGCQASSCHFVELPDTSTVDVPEFTAYFEENGTAGEVFFQLNNAANKLVKWDLGNGFSSSQSYFSHTYSDEGFYEICVTVTDVASGDASSYCKTMYINPSWWFNSPWNTSASCSSDFIIQKDSSKLGTLLYLTDLSFAKNAIINWLLGNDGISNKRFPHAKFYEPASENICLNIVDTTANCFDNYCQTINPEDFPELKNFSDWSIAVIPTPVPKSVYDLTTTAFADNTDKTISIFPNPAADFIHITLPFPSEKTVVYLTDIQGKTIKNINFSEQNITFDVSYLPDGVYLMKILAKNTVFTQKISLIR